jgi:hypothetical protein
MLCISLGAEACAARQVRLHGEHPVRAVAGRLQLEVLDVVVCNHPLVLWVRVCVQLVVQCILRSISNSMVIITSSSNKNINNNSREQNKNAHGNKI